MRVLVVNGAPRRSGYTRELLDLFLKGVEKAGGELDLIDLREVDIRPCLGCYGCWNPKRSGECVQNDDMSSLRKRYSISDTVVFATPLYFYSFSARLKTFIERLMPLTKPELKLSKKNGLMQNLLRDPENNPSRSVLIAVAGHRDVRSMDGLVSTFESIAEGLGTKPVGKLLRTESFFLDFPANIPFTMRKIRAAFEKAGHELVTDGHIQEKTERDASLYLTRSAESFKQQFSIYWQIAGEMDESNLHRKELRKAAGEDLRILMPELSTRFDPTAASDLEVVFQFELDGKQPGIWHVEISNKTCCVHANAHPSPTITISTSSETFLDIILQRDDPRRIIAKGRLKFEGNKSLFARFGRLFPPPRT